MKFWDASAIIPLCLEQSHSPFLRHVTEADSHLLVWWATPVECWSAFARLRRENLLNKSEEAQARVLLAALGNEWTEIGPSRDLRELAARALSLHPIRAADALQLAAALIWAKGLTSEHEFVCLDHRLREAAQAEGFQLVPALE